MLTDSEFRQAAVRVLTRRAARVGPVQNFTNFLDSYIVERNVAQLNLISVHRCIPNDLITWTQLVERGGVLARVQHQLHLDALTGRPTRALPDMHLRAASWR